jgi:signal transduction histidine kinase
LKIAYVGEPLVLFKRRFLIFNLWLAALLLSVFINMKLVFSHKQQDAGLCFAAFMFFLLLRTLFNAYYLNPSFRILSMNFARCFARFSSFHLSMLPQTFIQVRSAPLKPKTHVSQNVRSGNTNGKWKYHAPCLEVLPIRP